MLRGQRAGFVLGLLGCFQMAAQEFQPYTQRHQRLVQGIDFSPNGKTLYFSIPHREYLESKDSILTEDVPRLAIYKAAKNGERWEDPVPLSFSGRFKEYEPTISPTGNLLLFNSDRPLKGDKPMPKNGIWFSKLKKGRWKEPKPLSKLNTAQLERSYATISENGTMVYVAEKTVDGKSKYALYQTLFRGTRTKNGNPIPGFDPSKGSGDPWISLKGDYLIFTMYNPSDWQGSCNLYISFLEGGVWSSPLELKELNGKGPDFSPCVSPDGEWIYYLRNFRFVRVPFQTILNQYRRAEANN